MRMFRSRLQFKNGQAARSGTQNPAQSSLASSPQPPFHSFYEENPIVFLHFLWFPATTKESFPVKFFRSK